MAGSMVIAILQCFLLCINFKLVLAQFTKCQTIDQCSCETDYGEINLWKLAGTAEGGKPRFPRIRSKDKIFESISWNPCKPYSESGGSQNACHNVAACAKQKFIKYYWGIATQESATCELYEGRCTLKYTGKYSGSITSFVIIILNCDQSDREGKVDEMDVHQNYTSITFQTNLNYRYACLSSSSTTATSAPPTPAPSGRSSGGTSEKKSSGLSLGSKLLITFLCISIAYIIIGTVFNRYARHIKGKEAIPNYSFWTDLPHLIKDGGSFTFHSVGRLCGRGSNKGGYASI